MAMMIMRRDRRRAIDAAAPNLIVAMRVEEVVQYLCHAGVFTEYIVGKIRAHRTQREAVEELLRQVKTRGDRAFDELYRALLFSRQSNLANYLRPFLDATFVEANENVAPQIQPTVLSEVTCPAFDEIKSIEEMPVEDFDECGSSVPPLDEPLHFDVDLIDGDGPIARELENYERNKDTIYPHFSSPKGLALIINNKRFSSMPERTGTDVDRKNLENLYQQLGYKTIVECDLTSVDMGHAITRFAMNEAHWQASSAVIAVLTHGEHNCILGVDDRPVDIHRLLSFLNAEHCPALAGKPKVVFFQACRGERRDSGIDCTDAGSVSQPDAPFFGLFGCVQPPRQMETRRPRIPIESDFLIAYATPPFHVSWRNSLRGSWFIQSICEIFAKHARQKHLADMMTMVNQKVSEFETGGRYKQVPEIHSRLRKNLFFFPGITLSSAV